MLKCETVIFFCKAYEGKQIAGLDRVGAGPGQGQAGPGLERTVGAKLGWAGLAPENKAPRVLGVTMALCGRTNKHPAVPEHNLCISRLGNSRSQASSASSQPGGTP